MINISDGPQLRKNSKFGRASGGIACGIHLNSDLIEMSFKYENM
jgi:hypothetical protein